MRGVANLADRVTRTGIHVSDLNTNNSRPRKTRKGIRPHPPLRVSWNCDDPIATEAKHCQSLKHCHMYFLADNDRDWGRTKEPVLFYVPVGIQ